LSSTPSVFLYLSLRVLQVSPLLSFLWTTTMDPVILPLSVPILVVTSGDPPALLFHVSCRFPPIGRFGPTNSF
jgi:hypothetical protein